MARAKDGRPPVWIGHVVLRVPSLARARAFFLRLGLRGLARERGVAILELRGGTHLVLLPGGKRVKGEDAPFDLMVDDLDASRALSAKRGLRPSPVEEGHFHLNFTVVAPSGHVVTVNSSHVGGRSV